VGQQPRVGTSERSRRRVRQSDRPDLASHGGRSERNPTDGVGLPRGRRGAAIGRGWAKHESLAWFHLDQRKAAADRRPRLFGSELGGTRRPPCHACLAGPRSGISITSIGGTPFGGTSCPLVHPNQHRHVPHRRLGAAPPEPLALIMRLKAFDTPLPRIAFRVHSWAPFAGVGPCWRRLAQVATAVWFINSRAHRVEGAFCLPTSINKRLRTNAGLVDWDALRLYIGGLRWEPSLTIPEPPSRGSSNSW
jgi:hypothetical protein